MQVALRPRAGRCRARAWFAVVTAACTTPSARLPQDLGPVADVKADSAVVASDLLEQLDSVDEWGSADQGTTAVEPDFANSETGSTDTSGSAADLVDAAEAIDTALETLGTDGGGDEIDGGVALDFVGSQDVTATDSNDVSTTKTPGIGNCWAIGKNDPPIKCSEIGKPACAGFFSLGTCGPEGTVLGPFLGCNGDQEKCVSGVCKVDPCTPGAQECLYGDLACSKPVGVLVCIGLSKTWGVLLCQQPDCAGTVCAANP